MSVCTQLACTFAGGNMTYVFFEIVVETTVSAVLEVDDAPLVPPTAYTAEFKLGITCC